jgi:hypothetical protein
MSDNEESPNKVVNSQVLDAVRTTTASVMGNFAGLDTATQDVRLAHGTATVYANTIAYPKVSQAAAFAVQDATDYLRNITTMSTTAQGVIMKLMVEHKEQAPLYFPILQQVQAAVTAAQKNFADVGTAAAQVLKDFEE